MDREEKTYKPASGKRTYSEAMSEAMEKKNSKQSLLSKISGNNDNEGDESNKKLRLLWIITLIFAAGVMFWFYTDKYLSGPKFASFSEKLLNHYLGSERVRVSNFNWGKNRAVTPSIIVRPRDNDFIKTFELKSLSCVLPVKNVILNRWDFKNIRVSELKIDLADGDMMKLEEKGEAIIKSDGLLRSKIDPKKLKFDKIIISNLTLNWGTRASNYGSIKNTEAEIISSDGGLKIKLSGGEYSQNWIKGATIVSANLFLKEYKLKVLDSELKFIDRDRNNSNDDSSISLSGIVDANSGEWDFDINLGMRSVKIYNLLEVLQNPGGYSVGSYDLNKHLIGSINMSSKMTCKSFYSDDGFVISGQISGNRDVRIKKLPLFLSMNPIFPNGNFPRLIPYPSKIDFFTKGGNFVAEKIDMKCPNVCELSGNLRYNLESRLFTGDMDVKFTESVLKKHMKFANQVFVRTEDNKYRLDLEINDAPSDLTKRIGDEISSEFREYNVFSNTGS